MNNLNVIHPDAQLGENVQVGNFTSIGADVIVGNNTWIGNNVSIMDGVRIGDNCKIFPGAIVGAIPQDLKFKGEHSLVNIGNNVIIREYCTINRGTEANFSTEIGDNCLLMAYVHVAHDCIISKNCILANNVTLAGHIFVGEFAVLGGMAAVHQFVKIGKHSMVGGGSLVRKDIPPYIKAAREPLSYAGVNAVGLSRRGFSRDVINSIQDIYRVLFIKGYNTRQALKIIETDLPFSKERQEILDFICDADRGLLKGFRAMNNK